MKQQTFNNINSLLEPKKLLSIGIVCLIAFLIIYFLWKKVKETAGNAVSKIASNQQLNDYMQETGEQLSYTEAEYVSMANQLYAAMKGWGTDEDTINAVFNRMRNNADVYKLVNVFGSRDGEDLYAWIDGDYVGEPTEINRILQSKGISIRFA